ncbi:MAG: ankyrin repeat domain-containing protein, partial [Verrucomicrobiota bacterium]|nr:ankyrin repeat domain-containing protein [Verrucomicrobiota bacterium]
LVGCGPSMSIHDAAKDGNIEVVKQHLAAGADVELKCVNCGDTILGHAVSGGHIEIVELLVSKGADVNAKDDKYGRTPLHSAAGARRKEIVELLIAEGAEVNAKISRTGSTPLHQAAGAGYKEIAELLIDNGADVNAKSDGGGTPLHSAAGNGRKEIAELLISAGADVNAKVASGPKQGLTPLDAAIQTKQYPTADLLRKHGGKTGQELALMPPRLVQHGRFAFSFDAREGKVYEVQDSFDLLNWEVIKAYTGTGTAVRFDEERDHDPPKIFYRVKVVE